MDSDNDTTRQSLLRHGGDGEQDTSSAGVFQSGSQPGKYSSFGKRQGVSHGRSNQTHSGGLPPASSSDMYTNEVPADVSPNIQQQTSSEEYKVYKRRWYILMMFSFAAMAQSAAWSIFGPIEATSEHAFGWDDGMIALLTNWGAICFLVFGAVAFWMLDVKGLRLACVSSTFINAAGTALRCISMDPPAVTWLMNAGQILVGIAGPVFMAGPAVVSATWFPPSQRTTATAIGTQFGAVGSCVAFLLDAQTIRSERDAIRLYMFIEAGFSIAVFIVMFVYFPSKPPLPPCPSAAIQREDFLAGVKQLFRRRQFWLVCFAYGVGIGVFYAWDSILAVVLKPHGVGQKEAGWIGFCGSLGSVVSSLIIPRIADYLKRMMKWIVIIFFAVGFASVLVLTLACMKVIPASIALFIISNVIAHLALAGSAPLLYELACENAYPTGEGTANGVMAIVNNVACLLFLSILMIPHIGSAWMNWTLLGSVGACIPALLIMKERYIRLDIDEHHPSLTAEITIAPPEQPEEHRPLLA